MSSTKLIILQQQISSTNCRLGSLYHLRRLSKRRHCTASIPAPIECRYRCCQGKLSKGYGHRPMPNLNHVPKLLVGIREVHNLALLLPEPSSTSSPTPTGYSSDCSIKSTDLKGYFSNEESEESTSLVEIWPLKSEGGKIPVQKFRPGRLYVTDLVDPWCEAQQFYDMDRKKMKRSVAAKRGTAYHEKKEREIAPVVRQVKSITREDKEAIKLIDQICKIDQLVQDGIAREIQVYGIINGYYISGRIDELIFTDCDHSALLLRKLNGDTKGPDITYPVIDRSKAQVYVSDLKSRKARQRKRQGDSPQKAPLTTNTLPFDNRHHQQLMLYQYLLQTMACGNFNYEMYYSKVKRLDIDCEFNQEILTALSEDYKEWSPLNDNINCLRHLLLVFESKVKLLEGKVSSYAFIDSVLQKSWENIESREYLFDPDMFQETLSDRLKFWQGKRLPRGVEIEESFKCFSCPFIDNCLWRYEKNQNQSQNNHNNVMNDGTIIDT